jgi:predicted glycosyltransferase
VKEVKKAAMLDRLDLTSILLSNDMPMTRLAMAYTLVLAPNESMQLNLSTIARIAESKLQQD